MINSLLLWLYRLSLLIFPRQFRQAFAEEMLMVYQSLLHEGKGVRGLLAIGIRELVQLPAAAWQAHQQTWQKLPVILFFAQVITLSPFHPLPAVEDGRFSRRQLFQEVALFLLAAIVIAWNVHLAPEGPLAWFGLGWLVTTVALPLFIWGLWRGLPRWAYPAGGLLLGYTLLLLEENRLAFFWFGLLLALVGISVTAVYTHHFLQPLPPFWQKVGNSLTLDWTRAAFGLYGMLPCFILVAFDDVYRNNQTPYLALALLLMVIGAWGYGRAHDQRRQFAILLSATSLTFGPVLLEQVHFYGDWLTAVAWLSSLWIFSITLLLLPMLASLIYRVWHAQQSTPEMRR